MKMFLGTFIRMRLGLRFIFFLVMMALSLVALSQSEQVSSYDTLRYYGPDTAVLDLKDFTAVAPRIDLEDNLILHGLKLYLDPASQGSFTLDIYGQEGGLPTPNSQLQLLPAQRIHIKRGQSSAEVKWDDPLVLDSDQFFLYISEIEGRIKLITDAKENPPSCMSEDGGTYKSLLFATDKKLPVNRKNLKVDFYCKPDNRFRNVAFVDVTKKHLGPRTYTPKSISCGDINQDGFTDLLIGRFLLAGAKKGRLKELTRKYHMPVQKGLKHIFLDFDNDGDLDVIFFRGLIMMMYVNEGGYKISKRKFDFPPMPFLSSITYADVTGNGFLDLFVTQQWSHYPKPAPNYFLFNNGKTLVNHTRWFYPKHRGSENFPDRMACDTLDSYETCLFDSNRNTRTKEAQFSDVDGDGDMDLYLTNYFLEQDEYFVMGDGDTYGSVDLRDKNLHKPIRDSELNEPYEPSPGMDGSYVRGSHGTGLEIVDIDNDLDMDLLISHLAHPKYKDELGHRPTMVFLNSGDGSFLVQKNNGIEYEETHASILTGDVNNDGLLDVFMTAYYGCRYADLFMQQPDGTFLNVANISGLSRLKADDDACFLDLDRDGLLDLLVNVDGKLKVFQNKTEGAANWLVVKLVDTKGNRDGVGAKVIVHSANRKMMREMGLAKGKLFQPPHEAHFGLGEETIEKVEVIWTDGVSESFDKVAINEVVTLKRKK